LETKTGHQILLMEGDGIGATVQRVGGETAGQFFVRGDESLGLGAMQCRADDTRFKRKSASRREEADSLNLARRLLAF
jgi:hypothetical protein